MLIPFYEKNKDIKLELNEYKDDLKYTILEIDNIKLNRLIDEKPKLIYRIINSKTFKDLFDSIINSYI